MHAETCRSLHSCQTDGVGFDISQKTSQKQHPFQKTTPNPTPSPPDDPRAADVIRLAAKIAALPPGVIAALQEIFSKI